MSALAPYAQQARPVRGEAAALRAGTSLRAAGSLRPAIERRRDAARATAARRRRVGTDAALTELARELLRDARSA